MATGRKVEVRGKSNGGEEATSNSCSGEDGAGRPISALNLSHVPTIVGSCACLARKKISVDSPWCLIVLRFDPLAADGAQK